MSKRTYTGDLYVKYKKTGIRTMIFQHKSIVSGEIYYADANGNRVNLDDVNIIQK